MGLPQHGLIRRAPDCQRRGATVAVLSDLSNGKSRATCPSPFGPEATAIPDSARPNVGRPGRLCPFVICSTGDALAFKVAVANRTSATCDGARGRARGRPEDRDSIFWGFERSRRATGSLTNSPTLSHIATIGFILAATVSRWSAPGSARIICLIVLLGHKRTAATHEHNRACRSRITRCARSATAAADRWVFDAAPRQRVGTGRHRTETEPNLPDIATQA